MPHTHSHAPVEARPKARPKSKLSTRTFDRNSETGQRSPRREHMHMSSHGSCASVGPAPEGIPPERRSFATSHRCAPAGNPAWIEFPDTLPDRLPRQGWSRKCRPTSDSEPSTLVFKPSTPGEGGLMRGPSQREVRKHSCGGSWKEGSPRSGAGAGHPLGLGRASVAPALAAPEPSSEVRSAQPGRPGTSDIGSNGATWRHGHRCSSRSEPSPSKQQMLGGRPGAYGGGLLPAALPPRARASLGVLAKHVATGRLRTSGRESPDAQESDHMVRWNAKRVLEARPASPCQHGPTTQGLGVRATPGRDCPSCPG